MREPADEEKAVMLMAEQALEIALDSCTFRWLFCWDGEADHDAFDCACCITWDEDIQHRCGCICHKRIRELERLFRVAMRSKEQHNKSWWWDRGITGEQKEK